MFHQRSQKGLKKSVSHAGGSSQSIIIPGKSQAALHNDLIYTQEERNNKL